MPLTGERSKAVIPLRSSLQRRREELERQPCASDADEGHRHMAQAIAECVAAIEALGP